MGYETGVSTGSNPGYFLSGWFRYDPNQCRDVLKNYSNLFWIWAEDQSGWNSGNAFATDAVVNHAYMCVGSGAFAYRDVSESACRDGVTGYRIVEAHNFDFLNYQSKKQDFNVYEIGFH